MSLVIDQNPKDSILEVAKLRIRMGMTSAFENNFKKAELILTANPGYQSHSLKKCAEDDHKYILLVQWDSIEAHEEGFRKSEGYQRWKKLLHHFYDPFPTVEHYLCLS